MNQDYHKQSLIDQALTKADYYEKKGDKINARKYFNIAEKIEKNLKKNKQTIIKVERNKRIR